VTSHETANQVTIGAVARIPKMSPNFRKSMMMSKPRPSSLEAPLEVRESVHERSTALSSGHESLETTAEGVEDRMSSFVRGLLIVGSVIVIVVLFVLLRPDPSHNRATPTPSTPTPTASPSASGSPSPTQNPAPNRTVIDVTFRDGAVRGPTEFTATQGEWVRILVRADISDHVHLHSYDLMADVAPGQPARIDFVAKVAGVFGCELEDAGIPLFRLEIVP